MSVYLRVAHAMFEIRCNSQQCIQGTDAGPCCVFASAQSRLEDVLSGTFEAAEGPAPNRTSKSGNTNAVGSGFVHFCAEHKARHREQCMAEDILADAKGLARKASASWHQLPQVERQQWNQEAKERGLAKAAGVSRGKWGRGGQVGSLVCTCTLSHPCCLGPACFCAAWRACTPSYHCSLGACHLPSCCLCICCLPSCRL